MTEPKWTPGPWVVVGEYYDIYAQDENNYANNYICQSSKSQSVRRKANANLMAAAPDLYAATDFVEFLEEKGYDENYFNHFIDLEDSDECICINVKQFDKIMRARRKARGE